MPVNFHAKLTIKLWVKIQKKDLFNEIENSKTGFLAKLRLSYIFIFYLFRNILQRSPVSNITTQLFSKGPFTEVT